jgi:hypothetical protein
MVTVWPRRDLSYPTPIDIQGVPKKKVDDICGAAVSHYAYSLSDRWISSIAVQNVAYKTARGPILIAWAPPNKIGQPHTPVLVFDLSQFDQESDFEQAFQIWKAKIEDDPKLWSRGWSLTRWKLFTRVALDHYGPIILSAFELLPWSHGGGDSKDSE